MIQHYSAATNYRTNIERGIMDSLFLELLRPLLRMLASDAARDGFSATIRAVFMIAGPVDAGTVNSSIIADERVKFPSARITPTVPQTMTFNVGIQNERKTAFAARSRVNCAGTKRSDRERRKCDRSSCDPRARKVS